MRLKGNFKGSSCPTQEVHEGLKDNVTFNWQVIGKHRKPLRRQLAEAIEIDRTEPEAILNSKNEYFTQNIRNLSLSNKGEQCEKCGRILQDRKVLQKHIEEFHVETKCDTCEYISFGSINLKYHYKQHH